MATTTGKAGISTHQLQLRRTFTASPERLFRAWTTPEELKRWHAPGALTVTLAEVDLRVGGHYRIHMREPEGKEHRVSGTYRVIEPPRPLVFSWQWEGDPVATEVSLEFRSSDGGTELVLTHGGFPTDDVRAPSPAGLERDSRQGSDRALSGAISPGPPRRPLRLAGDRLPVCGAAASP